MKKLIGILIILIAFTLLFGVGFLFRGITSADVDHKTTNEIMPFVSAAGNQTIPSLHMNCPPECDWGCYTDRTCCPEPDPGEPFCNDGY